MLTKGIAKEFLVFEMSLGSNSEVLFMMKFKIQISRHSVMILIYPGGPANQSLLLIPLL